MRYLVHHAVVPMALNWNVPLSPSPHSHRHNCRTRYSGSYSHSDINLYNVNYHHRTLRFRLILSKTSLNLPVDSLHSSCKSLEKFCQFIEIAASISSDSDLFSLVPSIFGKDQLNNEENSSFIIVERRSFNS